jgi:hypothetical protein
MSSEDLKEIPNEEWAKKLSPEEYFVTRERGTEAVSHLYNILLLCICIHEWKMLQIANIQIMNELN